MVAIVIAFPARALASLDSGTQIDPSNVQIEAPQVAPARPLQIEFK